MPEENEVNVVEPQNIGNATKEKLKQFVARIERLQEEKDELTADINEVFSEVAIFGLDKKVLRKIIAMRKKDPADIAEEEMMIDLYLEALE